MTRPRGNATSKAHRAERRAQALTLMKEGKSQTEIARELKVSRMTFWRDLQAIEAQFVVGSSDDVREFKQQQLDALMKIEEATAKGTIAPDVANALTRIRDSVAKLLGLDAPTRSVHFKAEAGDLFSMKMRKACDGLTEAQVEIVLDFAAKLPREAKKTVMDASWFPQPEPKLLGDGE